MSNRRYTTDELEDIAQISEQLGDHFAGRLYELMQQDEARAARFAPYAYAHYRLSEKILKMNAMREILSDYHSTHNQCPNLQREIARAFDFAAEIMDRREAGKPLILLTLSSNLSSS